MKMITKAQHDAGTCHRLMLEGHGECWWCIMREKSAAREAERPEFVADERALRPKDEWQR